MGSLEPVTELDDAALTNVVGGRHTQGPVSPDPELIQGIQQLAQAVQSVGQAKAQTDAQNGQQMMQMMGQMMQQRGGAGGRA